MYVTIPVKQETKQVIDEFRKIWGASSYDETLQKLAKLNNYILISELKGLLKGTPPFERDKRDRNFD